MGKWIIVLALFLLFSCEKYSYEYYNQEEPIISKYSFQDIESYSESDYVYDYHYDPMAGEYTYGPHYITRYETRPVTRYKIMTQSHTFTVNADTFYRAETGKTAVVQYKKVFKEVDDAPLYQETKVVGIVGIMP